MAAFNYNSAFVGGHIATDLELKTTDKGISAVTFLLAVKRSYSPSTDFLTISAWGTVAEFICNFFEKGSPIALDCELQSKNITVKEEKRSIIVIKAKKAYFVSSKNEPENLIVDEKQDENGV